MADFSMNYRQGDFEHSVNLRFYRMNVDIQAFATLEEAMRAEPNTDYGHGARSSGFAVLFELDGLFAVYVHSEDRYYSSFIPIMAKVRYTGWWQKGCPIEWAAQKSNLSGDEIDTLRSRGLGALVDMEDE